MIGAQNRKGGRVQDHDPRGFYFGHPTYTWYVERYLDTGESVWTAGRPCASCGLKPRPDGHDPCLGELPGVKYACCGHGVEEGYVMLMDGTVIRGRIQRWGPHMSSAEEVFEVFHAKALEDLERIEKDRERQPGWAKAAWDYITDVRGRSAAA